MADYTINDESWVNVGTLPVTLINNTPFIIRYIIASATPITLNDVSQKCFTETKELTGTVNDRLYLRLDSDEQVVYLQRDGNTIVATLVDYVIVPPTFTLQDIVDAFVLALQSTPETEFTAEVPTFGSGNTTDTAPYLGFRAERGAVDVFWVWNKAAERFGAYASANGLGTKVTVDIEADTFYGNLQGISATTLALENPIIFALSGDIAGSASFDGGSDFTLSTTLPHIIASGTYTKVTVNAKGQVIAGTAVASSDITGALGYTPFAPADAASLNIANKLVQRDSSGNFLAGTITASFVGPLAGNAATATILETTRTINGIAFNGSQNITINVADIPTLVTLLAAKQAISEKNQVNGYAGLDGSGKIDINQLPALAITDTYVVASEAAQLALTAQRGDVAVRTDTNNSYILQTEPASTLANWVKLESPASAVSSVAGKVGAVTLVANDISNATTVGKNVLIATDIAVARAALNASGYILKKVTTFTSSGTWTPLATTKLAIIRCQGGGGGAGGAGPGGTGVCATAGGSAGGYAERWMTSGWGATEPITIGTGGAGGNSSGGNGGNGTASSVGTAGALLSANGGGASGGSPTRSTTISRSSAPTPGGSAIIGGTGVDIFNRVISGAYGEYGLWANTTAYGGHGGRSVYGPGGFGNTEGGSGGTGVGYGAGGGGAAEGSAGGRVGGTGAAGIVEIEEYE